MEQAFFRHAGRLALFKSIGTHQEHWEKRWQARDLKRLLEQAASGDLGEFEHPFIQHLPRDGTILEAGCGTGMWARALGARGYRVEGIDTAGETLRLVREIEPSLNLREGDVLAIDVEDGHYAGSISIGVVEHFFGGPGPALAEAYRVLRPGGIALISVPYLNWPRRRLLSHLPEAAGEDAEGGLRFYQDHFDVSFFRRSLEGAGFEIVELFPYSLFGSVVRDWRLGRWLGERYFFHWRLARLVKRACQLVPTRLRMDLCHMMMFICRKPVRTTEASKA